MSQGAVSVANGTFPSVRAAINAALAALSSQQKGNTAPASVPAGTAWVDDSGTNWVLKIYDGSDWIAALTIDPTNNRVVSNDAQGDDLASAATTNIGGATGQFLRVTGTTAITGLGTAPAGTTRFVQFTGALTLTHNGTSLILPGAANITTAAGDVAAFVSLGSGNWKCLFYQKADGTPVGAVAAGATVIGAHSKLKITASSATITITADELVLEDASGNYKTVRAVSGTVGTGAAAGAGGIDAGSWAINTWYYVWGIWNGTTLSFIASTSGTAPTLPGGYTYKAMFGLVRTSGTATTLLATTQIGEDAQYVVGGSGVSSMPLAASGNSGNISTPTWTAIALGNFVPPGAARVRGTVFATVVNAGAIGLAPNNSYGAFTSTTNPPPVVINPAASQQDTRQFDFLLESTNIYYYSSSQTFVGIFIAGWKLNL